MTLDPVLVSNLILFAAALGAAFLAALWLSLIFWTFRDIRVRSRDRLARLLAVLVVAVLFVPGVLIYFILRPPTTLEEEYQHTLEEESLLQTIEENPLCPGCGRRIKDEWTACPNCHTRLRKPCHQCGKLMDLSWNLCPFCATPVPGMRKENSTIEDALSYLPTQPEADDSAPAAIEETIKS
jgi:RNA polymerase subunit RPABC4/transcription elongation factor Spt4